MTKEERLSDCCIEKHTKEELKNWNKYNPMCIGVEDPDDMEDGPMYKCWIYYRDGWGCTYASLCKYEKIIENG